MRKSSLGVAAAALVLAGIAAVGAPAAHSSKAPACQVTNSQTGSTFPNVQEAIDASAADDTLVVRGTCTGPSVIGHNLTLTGQTAKGFTAPTLDGGGQDTTVSIYNYPTVTINTLTITGGDGGSSSTGGIFAFGGTLTLNNSTVTGNTASQGGGIGIGWGVLNLNHSTVTANSAMSGQGLGGGIVLVGADVTLTDSTVSANTAGAGGGIVAAGSDGTDSSVELYGKSKVIGNTASLGGGVMLMATLGTTDEPASAATLTLHDSSRISANTAAGGAWPGYGGGVYMFNPLASLTMEDASTITSNSAAAGGGGIAVYGGGTFTGALAGVGGNVYRNTPDDILNPAPAPF